MSDDDDVIHDDDPTLFSQSSNDPFGPRLPRALAQMRRDRIPTPIQPPPPRPSPRPIQQVLSDRNGPHQHIRLRHPPQQDPSSSSIGERLEVPSPIDEDEVPTPPSAAEAAGSQLSMLSVNDMDIEPSNTEEDNPLVRLPSISLSPSHGLSLGEQVQRRLAASHVDFDAMDSGELEERLTVRKQRQRSGALSHGGSPSPVRAPIAMAPLPMDDTAHYDGPGGRPKRSFSMGFRADCEKCRMRVPGHMNHFVL